MREDRVTLVLVSKKVKLHCRPDLNAGYGVDNFLLSA